MHPNSAAKALVENLTTEGAKSFVRSLEQNGKAFGAQEDTLCDYKLEYPKPTEPAYYRSIVRLCLAFYNTYGGIVVIGVDDKSRVGGANKNHIDIEGLNRRIREICGNKIGITHFSLGSNERAVDLLVVPKRPANIPPIRLEKSVDKFEEGTTWFREGHEVLIAEGKDVSFLFGPRLSNQESPVSIPASMPPSPATIRHFVGRFDVLTQLFQWICQEDEPRKILYGRGGSGKSTIAYEFARIIRYFANHIDLFDGSRFDRVVYLSAKEIALNSLQGERTDTSSLVDFSNLKELKAVICDACEFSTNQSALDMDEAQCNEALNDIFENENILLVLDDIDTLTTKGLDAGFDYFYKLLIRARGTSRILYTQRNMPSSIENAIKVPGFTRQEEYEQFVMRCCERFECDVPEPKILNGRLKEVSEGIPLIIETIVGLKRISEDYDTAINRFLENRGVEARRYLFDREYAMLPDDNTARHVLAAISEFGRPCTVSDIESIVQVGSNAVSDAIGELLGFFISSETAQAGYTHFFLNQVTQQYVSEQIGTLAFGPAITERVKVFKAGTQRQHKEIYELKVEIDQLMRREAYNDVLLALKRKYPPKISEHVAYRSFKGKTYFRLGEKWYPNAREEFKYCRKMSHEDAEMMRYWYTIEKRAGSFLKQQEVCSLVIDGKSYNEKVKHEFRSKRAQARYHRARDLDGVDSFDGFAASLIDHAKAYRFFLSQGFNTADSSGPFRGSAFAVINSGMRMDFDKEIIKVFRDLYRETRCFDDPLFDPLVTLTVHLATGFEKSQIQRRRSLLQQLNADFSQQRLVFLDRIHRLDSAKKWHGLRVNLAAKLSRKARSLPSP